MPNPLADPANDAVALYSPKLATAYLEEVALGHSWKTTRPNLVALLGESHVPVKEQSMFRYMLKYPEFGDAYEEARRWSARALEAKALEQADELLDLDTDTTAQQVRGRAEAMSQWRWSAGKRDKARFGDQNSNATPVAITITTPINLGQPGIVEHHEVNPYELAARITAEPPEEAEVVVPEEVAETWKPRKMPDKKPRGKPPAGHKPLATTKKTEIIYARNKARRAVAAAQKVGKKDD